MIENNIRLRPLSLEDSSEMLKMLNNKAISKFFSFSGKSFTEDDVVSFIEASNKSNARYDFAISGDNNYFGTITLKNINYESKNAEYAISLTQTAIGRGIAKTATDQILNFAFNKLLINEVYLSVLKHNLRAIRFYEKYGFKNIIPSKLNKITSSNENLLWFTLKKL